MAAASSDTMTLFDLQTLVRKRVAEAFPLPCWVTAEISELKVNNSGHCYLELIEKSKTGGQPCAKVNAVIWRNHYSMISNYFATVTGTNLQCGIKVLVKVVISYHELYGFNFQIVDIEPSFTLGDSERQKQETIRQLTQDGIIEMNHELELSATAQRIAVVSSSNAAGFQDFMKEIDQSQFRFDIALFNSVMQGDGSENSIIAALDAIADRMDDFDCVVVIRGGGSQSDLGCFNNYRLCSHLAQFPLPIVTGIGHDKDLSVADMVAHTALKTPTAVAVFLVQQLAEFDAKLDEASKFIADRSRNILDSQRERLIKNGYMLKTLTSDYIKDNDRQLSVYQTIIESKTGRQIEQTKARIDLLSRAVGSGVEQFLSNRNKELTLFEVILDGKTPRKILAMGYSVARVAGRVVRSAKDVKAGDEMVVQVSDSEIITEVKNVKKYGKN